MLHSGSIQIRNKLYRLPHSALTYEIILHYLVMIYRIRIKGFKNIKDLEVFLGPFSCLAGGNGVGKSNFFDALSFLRALSNRDNTLIKAAYQIRSKDDDKKLGKDIQNLFYQDELVTAKIIAFEVDLVCSESGIDDLGQIATSNITLLRYTLEIGLDLGKEFNTSGLYIKKEELIPLSKTEAKNILTQMGASYDWLKSVVGIGSRKTPFIETHGENVFIRTDQKQGGQKRILKIKNLPRTILSTATSIEYPTMTVVQREFQKLRILQFEPTALREPDPLNFSDGAILTSEGGHLPSSLKRLKGKDPDILYRISNRLKELVDDSFELQLEEDAQRDLLILTAKRKGGTYLPAKSLSDGTLRFLALATAIEDPDFDGIICLEEPENGIHPERIRAIIKLLEDMAFDFDFPIDEDNPFRQVIVNTHSPGVVSVVPAESLIFAYLESNSLQFKFLDKTWHRKVQPQSKIIQRGEILRYLQPLPTMDLAKSRQKKTVREASDIQIQINFLEPNQG